MICIYSKAQRCLKQSTFRSRSCHILNLLLKKTGPQWYSVIKIYNSQKTGQCVRTSMWCSEFSEVPVLTVGCFMVVDKWIRRFCFNQWVVWMVFMQLIDILTALVVDGWGLWIHVLLKAEVLHWVLVYKLMSSSQPQCVPRACCLPEPPYWFFIILQLLSFQRLHITVLGEDGKWKGLLVGDRLAWGQHFFFFLKQMFLLNWKCVQRQSCFLAVIFCWSFSYLLM